MLLGMPRSEQVPEDKFPHLFFFSLKKTNVDLGIFKPGVWRGNGSNCALLSSLMQKPHMGYRKWP